METILHAEIERAKQSLLESYQLITIYGDNDTKDTSPFMQLMADLCHTRHESARCEHALTVAKEQGTVEAFESAYQTDYENGGQKNFSAKRLNEYKAFQNELKNVSAEHAVTTASQPTSSNRIEFDELVMESEIQVVDPLTKLRMHDPVRNTLCGHHYEKKSILEAIKLNPRLRCPVAGCSNREHVTESQLTPDNQLKMEILRMTKEEDDIF